MVFFFTLKINCYRPCSRQSVGSCYGGDSVFMWNWEKSCCSIHCMYQSWSKWIWWYSVDYKLWILGCEPVTNALMKLNSRKLMQFWKVFLLNQQWICRKFLEQVHLRQGRMHSTSFWLTFLYSKVDWEPCFFLYLLCSREDWYVFAAKVLNLFVYYVFLGTTTLRSNRYMLGELTDGWCMLIRVYDVPYYG